MFERLGSRSSLKEVELVEPHPTSVIRHTIEENDDEPRVEAAQSSVYVPKDVLEAPALRHIEAMRNKPAKPLTYPPSKADRRLPVLTEDMPRLPHVKRRLQLSESYRAIFASLRMGGPGLRVPVHHGDTTAAKLRAYLVEHRLHGRPIVQYWGDRDMVFWVSPEF